MPQTSIKGGSATPVRIVNVDTDPDLAARPVEGGAAALVYVTNLDANAAANPEYDTAKFGDVTGGNYSEFEDDGTLVAYGNATCYLDLLQSVVAAQLESPSADFQRNVAELSITAETSARYPTDYIGMNLQLNHDWSLGTAIYPHIHWWQTEADMPNWLIGYRWQKQGSAKTTAWTLKKWVDNAFAYSAGTLNQITNFGSIAAPAGYGQVSDIVQLRLYRDVTNVSTYFAGSEATPLDQDIVNFDIHIRVDTLGSRQEFIK